MAIILPLEWEKRIADKVAGGEFPDAEEVVREGLRRLLLEEEHLAELRAKFQEGIDVSEREEGQDGDEFFAELEREMNEAARPR